MANLQLAAAAVCSTGLILAPASMAECCKVGMSLQEGAITASPVHVSFIVKDQFVRPAAEGVIPGTGHFHMMIDAPPVKKGDKIPADKKHINYGDAQTEDDIELSRGQHTLVLQFADAENRALGEEYTNTVHLTIQ